MSISTETPISFLTVGQLTQVIQEAVASGKPNQETVNSINPIRTRLNVKQTAKFLGLSVSSVYQFTSKNRIPHHKQFKHLYFFEDELAEFLNEGKVPMQEELDQQLMEKLVRRNKGKSAKTK
jgi:predicted DNA-binding transcriptional regulator AlpA